MEFNIKIVGKIELNEPVKNNTIQLKYKHFSERLMERYGLTISWKEYINLSKQDFPIIREAGGNSVKIKIEFKGVMMYALKEKGKGKLLTTALPLRGIQTKK
jgi:hypothetical protein